MHPDFSCGLRIDNLTLAAPHQLPDTRHTRLPGHQFNHVLARLLPNNPRIAEASAASLGTQKNVDSVARPKDKYALTEFPHDPAGGRSQCA